MTTKKEEPKEPAKPEVKPEVKKDTVKDLSVKQGDAGNVAGGGGGTPSKPRTPANYTCPAC